MFTVQHISSRQELLEFVKLWALLRNVTLRWGGNVHDSMSWKWVANGEYSTKTAYQIQFQGSFTPFRIGKL
jgi:hypothetical protein